MRFNNFGQNRKLNRSQRQEDKLILIESIFSSKLLEIMCTSAPSSNSKILILDLSLDPPVTRTLSNFIQLNTEYFFYFSETKDGY